MLKGDVPSSLMLRTASLPGQAVSVPDMVAFGVRLLVIVAVPLTVPDPKVLSATLIKVYVPATLDENLYGVTLIFDMMVSLFNRGLLLPVRRMIILQLGFPVRSTVMVAFCHEPQISPPPLITAEGL